jgi:hypothetical protein
MVANAMAGRPLSENVARDVVLGFAVGGTLGLAAPAAAAAMTTSVSTAEVAAAGQGLGMAGSAVSRLGSLAAKFGTTGGNIVNQAVTSGTRMIDTANRGNVNAVIPRLDGASGFIRVTLNPEQNKIISAGLQSANMVVNGIKSGRFEVIN